jgi:hypothetical protein
MLKNSLFRRGLEVTGKGDEGGAKAAGHPRARTGCSRSPAKRLLEGQHVRGSWVCAVSWTCVVSAMAACFGSGYLANDFLSVLITDKRGQCRIKKHLGFCFKICGWVV